MKYPLLLIVGIVEMGERWRVINVKEGFWLYVYIILSVDGSPQIARDFSGETREMIRYGYMVG